MGKEVGTMNQRELERFDMTKKPMRTAWYLRPLTYILSAPDVKKHKAIITKTRAEGLKPPYLMLCNHNAFLDFKVATKAIYPDRANYIVAIDGFIGREGLLRRVGCICKRKFTEDITLIRQCKRVIQNGDVLMIYPEARYSLCGTTAVLPASLGKLCKLLGVPVVTFICHGHHIDSPFWNLHPRGIRPTEAEFTVQYTADELKAATPDEINARLVEAFQYDEYAWQKARGIRVTYEKRAEGLEKVLYQCPHAKRNSAWQARARHSTARRAAGAGTIPSSANWKPKPEKPSFRTSPTGTNGSAQTSAPRSRRARTTPVRLRSRCVRCRTQRSSSCSARGRSVTT